MKAGIQLSSFRPVIKTIGEVKEAFKKLREMGCEYVQIQWIDPSVSDEAVAGALKDYGIVCVSTQDQAVAVLKDLDRVLRQNRLWGSGDICVSRIPADMRSIEGIKSFASTLNELKKRACDNGQTLSFHGLAADFEYLEGARMFDRLMDGLDGVRICLDIYHALNAGVDIPAFFKQHEGKVDIIHCKEQNAAGTLVPVGQGITDWKTILTACKERGVKYALAEQEKWTGDPFEVLGESFKRVRELAE